MIKRSLLWSALLSAVLGWLACWMAQVISPCVILQRSESLVCYQAKYSANGQYLAGLVSDKKVGDNGKLQLWDIQAGQNLGHIPESTAINPVHLAWGCANDGSLLSVRCSHVEQKVEKGTSLHSFVYTFYRKGRNELAEQAVSSWTLDGSEMLPPNHQFAFSRDGLVLAHGVHTKGKVWIESIDTMSGKVLKTQTIENAYFLMSLKEFPKRNGFVAITHPPSSQPPGFDTSKCSLLVMDGNLEKINLRSDYPEYPFDNSFFTADGEHLYLTQRKGVNSPLLDLKTGEFVPVPLAMAETLNGATPVQRTYRWPVTFGKCLMLTSDTLSSDGTYVIDWQQGTSRQVKYTPDAGISFTTPPCCWLPGSSGLLINRASKVPPNPIVAWYKQFKKYMKWGSWSDGYYDLAIFDLETMQTTRWHGLDDHWSGIQVHPTVDGNQLVVVLNDTSRGMQIEVWDNPAVPRFIPRWFFFGAGVGLTCFVLLVLWSRLKKRMPRTKLRGYVFI